MKMYFKIFVLFSVYIFSEVFSSADAKSTLFTFTLAVKDVSNPQILVGPDRRQAEANEQNIFKVKVRYTDYYFRVQYKHKDENREAVCPISGTPRYITAIINPEKEGRNACITEETSRKFFL